MQAIERLIEQNRRQTVIRFIHKLEDIQKRVDAMLTMEGLYPAKPIEMFHCEFDLLRNEYRSLTDSLKEKGLQGVNGKMAIVLHAAYHTLHGSLLLKGEHNRLYHLKDMLEVDLQEFNQTLKPK